MSKTVAGKMETVNVQRKELQIYTNDRSNLWDQLCEMLKVQGWTSQDLATTSLLREMDNVVPIFLVRKSDNLLLGSIILVETADLVFGNVYIMREGYRASGMGMQMVRTFQGILGETFKRKPFVARGVKYMLEIYAGPPFFCEEQYVMYSFRLTSKRDAKEFFPAPGSHQYQFQNVHDMNFRQFQQLIDYDKMVTGVDRTRFLENYYSITFVEAAVIRDQSGAIKGMASIVPTPSEPHLYKFNPLYAENREAAAILVHAIVDCARDPEATFVLSVRTQSAGDWILQKCHETNKSLYCVGKLVNAMNHNQRYKDPSRTDLIFAPTNSAAHFDG